MSIGSEIISRSVKHYKAVTWTVALVTLTLAVLAAAPSLFPGSLSFLNSIKVDTDPENMLSPDEPVRVFNTKMKRTMNLHDMVVVGIVNADDPNGVFNVRTLGKVYKLAEFAKTLRGEKIGEPKDPEAGVIEVDMLAPSTVDSIEPIPGGVSFSWLMQNPPTTDAEAMAVWRKASRVPFLFGTLISDKTPGEPVTTAEKLSSHPLLSTAATQPAGAEATASAMPTGPPSKAVALYLPLTSKDLSHAVYVRLQDEIAKLGGPEKFYITGLPVAEDTFGVEMFIQMAISAPAAMIVIFVLMLVFFRKLVLIIAPMLVAMVSVIITMGLLIICGFPVHIMSSMIPIFIMPIAVLDSIHIISEFFERYQATRDREKTIRSVMGELFTPMLYTSLTSTAGFASEALAPIPPVQVFGIFVAIGIMVAWVLTVTFIPAFIMLIPAKKLENFGAVHSAEDDTLDQTWMGRFLRGVAGMTYRRAKLIVVGSLIVLSIAGYGISRININDNPVKWFEKSHPIREADTVLNEYFGGTYMAYLAMQYEPGTFDANDFAAKLHVELADRRAAVTDGLARLAPAAEQLATEPKYADANSDTFIAKLRSELAPSHYTATYEQLVAWDLPSRLLNLDAGKFNPPPGIAKPTFTPRQYAAELAKTVEAVTKQYAADIQTLDDQVDPVAETKPTTRDEMLRRLAARYAAQGSALRPGSGPAVLESDLTAGAVSGPKGRQHLAGGVSPRNRSLYQREPRRGDRDHSGDSEGIAVSPVRGDAVRRYPDGSALTPRQRSGQAGTLQADASPTGPARMQFMEDVPALPAGAPTGDEPALPSGAPSGGAPALPSGAPTGDEPPLPVVTTGPATTAVPESDPYLSAADDAVSLLIDQIRQQSQVFKDPAVLDWMVRLQDNMAKSKVVGKSNSIADLVGTVQRDLLGGAADAYRVPSNSDVVANCIEQYGNSHRPRDIWHFVTPNFQDASIWVQLTSGDNRDMQKVVNIVSKFAAENPPPLNIRLQWFGLTYINVVWQDKMVTGMLEAFLGSFLVVLLLMVVLFRSVLWGLLSMIPLTVTIAAIYGAIGLAGKDYDMPVAVLSSLTLGLAVDFSIHFLARARAMRSRYGSWKDTLPHIFGEPARAITRNIIVIAAGFLPLLLAPLVPYQTVGILLAVILLIGGVATLLLLPALIRLLERKLFGDVDKPMPAGCNCGVCIVSAIVAVAILIMSVQPYVPWDWTTLTWIGAAIVPVAALLCGLRSRRQKCKVTDGEDSQG